MCAFDEIPGLAKRSLAKTFSKTAVLLMTIGGNDVSRCRFSQLTGDLLQELLINTLCILDMDDNLLSRLFPTKELVKPGALML